VLLLASASAATAVATDLTKSAGALEKLVDIVGGIVKTVTDYVTTLFAARDTFESGGLVDYYDADSYETGATRPEHDAEANRLVEGAWAKAREAKEAKRDAVDKCRNLPSYADCYADMYTMQDSSAQANSLALAATKRALSLASADLAELEELGAGWSYYTGEEHGLALEVADKLGEGGEYAPIYEAMRTYSTIDTTAEGEITAAYTQGLIDAAARVMQGTYLSVEVVKAPWHYHHAFNALVGNNGLVFNLLDDHNALQKAKETMRAANTAWEKKSAEEVGAAENALSELGKEEPWLALKEAWEANAQRVREAQYLEKEALFVRAAGQRYWLATSTTRFQEAYDKAVLAADGLGSLERELLALAESKRAECYAPANTTTAIGAGLEVIAEEDCKRGDTAPKGRAIEYYEEGAAQKALLSSSDPIADVKAMLARAKASAAGDEHKLAQIKLLEDELKLAETLDADSALPILTSIADRARALAEAPTTAEAPAAEAEAPAAKMAAPPSAAKPTGSEKSATEPATNFSWSTEAAQQKLADAKKALDTVVNLNFTVATVMDENDWLKLKERLDSLKNKPSAEEYERKLKLLQELEKDLDDAIVSSMQRAKQEHETATAVMQEKQLFDYAYLLEESRKEYERGYYNRAFIYAAYAKAMTVTQKRAITGLVGMEAAPVLLGLAVAGGVVWQLKRREKETPMRRVLKKIRARESTRTSQRDQSASS
jgi:hypothetical protein